MRPTDRVLFVGGTFSISLYAKVNSIKNYRILSTAFDVSINHNANPIFIMEDAQDICGSDARDIVRYAQDNGYVLIPLSYKDPFPTDDEIEEFVDSKRSEKNV